MRKEEYAYIHLQKRPNFEVTFDINQTSSFYITPKGFFVKEDNNERRAIKKWNRYEFFKENKR